MSEIPLYPDECEHGNVHIEGVNECVICQRDRLALRMAELERELAHACSENLAFNFRVAGEINEARGQRDAARAEVERMRPVYEAVRAYVAAARSKANLAPTLYNELAAPFDAAEQAVGTEGE